MSRFLILILFSTKCFGQVPSDSLPSFAIKYNPVPLFLEVDPHIQFSGEYFVDSKRSVQATFGFANDNIFQSSNNDKVMMLRLEHRKYFRPFTSRNKGRGYWAQEIMYKNVQERKIAHKIEDPQAPGVNYQLNVNVAAFHLKLGHEFVGQNGFPVIDIFMGFGARAYKNFNQNLPQGYEFNTPTMFNRLDGQGSSVSAVLGIGFGFGNRK